jgi:hypothetical protein
MREHMENETTIEDGSSHLFAEIEGSPSAMLIGMAEALNHSISHIRPMYDASATREATKIVVAERSLSEKQRASLCIYYGKHIAEAAALTVMGDSLRTAVFRKVLEGPLTF